jgi:hypothetical protein
MKSDSLLIALILVFTTATIEIGNDKNTSFLKKFEVITQTIEKKFPKKVKKIAQSVALKFQPIA